MNLHYRRYFWKEGIPIGCDSVNPLQTSESYKIISDPYRKRISIEKYAFLHFDTIVYDSALINFREFKKPELASWQKKIEKDIHGVTKGYIRNQEDRLVFIETYQFQEGLCRECRVHSPHGILLSVHKMSYRHLGDPFDGVTLYDSRSCPVVIKRYVFDEECHQFTDLIEEQWDMSKEKECLN